jgi:hypothetical protein
LDLEGDHIENVVPVFVLIRLKIMPVQNAQRNRYLGWDEPDNHRNHGPLHSSIQTSHCSHGKGDASTLVSSLRYQIHGRDEVDVTAIIPHAYFSIVLE